MSKKLYVGNLPYDTTDDQLREIFSGAGAVDSASVLTDKFTGRSRGFGFVEMPNDEEALAAVEKYNGYDMGGRTIVVNEARPMGERSERPPMRGGDRGGDRGGRSGGFGRP